VGLTRRGVKVGDVVSMRFETMRGSMRAMECRRSGREGRRLKAGLMLLTTMALLLPAATGVASTADAWRIVASPSPGHYNDLIGVVRVSSANAWAVGKYNVASGEPLQALIVHWDGWAWTVVEAPNDVKANAQLIGVAASGPDDVWAVGNQWGVGRNRADSLIEHYNGAVWAVVQSPSPEADVALSGVSAASATDAWAVGETEDGRHVVRRTLALHWDGRKWSVVPTIDPRSYSELFAVLEISPDDVWAVGDYATHGGSELRSLIEHWDGSAWSIVKHPKVGLTDQFNALSATSTSDVWAVGATSHGTRGASTSIAEHWDGSEWSVIPVPDPGKGNALLGVSAVSRSRAWAVGVIGRADFTTRTLVERWDGVRWKRVESPNPPGQTYDVMFAVSAGVGGAFAVGQWELGAATRTLVETHGRWSGPARSRG
jgi:hypothetical protein